MYLQWPPRCIVCNEEECCHGTYHIDFVGTDQTFPDAKLAVKACLMEMLDKLLQKRVPNDNSAQAVGISARGPLLDERIPIIHGATLIRADDTAFVLAETLAQELDTYIQSNGFGNECWAAIVANPGSVWIQTVQQEKHDETDDDSDSGLQ